METRTEPAKQQGRYHNLIFNTLVFAVATFAPKLVSFLMQFVLTRYMDITSYGGFDQIQSFCNLALPIVYITISEAVIRFGSEGKVQKDDVFTTAMLVLTVGYGIFLTLYPLLRSGDTMSQYAKYIYPYVLASALRTILGHFVRSLGNAKLFAIDGVITTLSTTILTLLFLIPFQMGAVSQIIATIIADALSAVFLFVMSKSWRYFSLKTLDFSVAKDMIVYAIFTMPTAVMWWIINASNRSIIRSYHGLGAQGLYAAATRIPSLITMVSQVFMQAWQMSVFTEHKGKDQEEFFASIFKSYYTFIFVAISGFVLIVRPFISIFLGNAYYNSWQYIPFLLLGIGLSCLVTFLGTIYNAEKRNGMVAVTTAVGAMVNFFLNFLLIPTIGVQGAAVATFISYLVVFYIRLIDTQRYMDLNIEPLRLTVNIALLVAQIFISLGEPPRGMLYQALILLIIVVLNIRHILFLFSQVWNVFLHRKKKVTSAS